LSSRVKIRRERVGILRERHSAECRGAINSDTAGLGAQPSKIITDGQDHRGGSGTRHNLGLFDPQTSAACPRTSPQRVSSKIRISHLGASRWTNPNGGQNGGQIHSQTKRIEAQPRSQISEPSGRCANTAAPRHLLIREARSHAATLASGPGRSPVRLPRIECDALTLPRRDHDQVAGTAHRHRHRSPRLRWTRSRDVARVVGVRSWVARGDGLVPGGSPVGRVLERVV
jgi:hypothetical protein